LPVFLSILPRPESFQRNCRLQYGEP
jgi:hypothetical protein